MKTRHPILSVFVLVASVFMATQLAFAQQYQIIYPNGKMAVSERPLPAPVYEAQKHMLVVEGEFFSRNNRSQILFRVWQTGFVDAKSGYIVSARHGLVETAMTLLGRYNLDYGIDNQGILQGMDYEYRFYASILAATKEASIKKYPLSVIAMGSMGTDNDVIVFKSTEQIPVRGLEISGIATVGETAYFSGTTRSSMHFHDADGEQFNVIFQNLKFNVEGIVLSIFENVTSSKIKKTYLLSRPVKEGFSGGPVLNKAGKVIAMGIATDELFSYAISSEDILAVINSIK